MNYLRKNYGTASLCITFVLLVAAFAYAQNSGYVGIGPMGLPNTCPTASSTVPFALCPATDGNTYVSNLNLNGGAPQALMLQGLVPAGTVKSVNNVQPDSGGNVMIGFANLTTKPTQAQLSCPQATMGPSGFVSGVCTIQSIQ